ncbi:class II fructose-1,6-bisphosphate aldolase [Gracilibacillus alcaliphilus]|uniref:class II fructose-1,6-bisphosphate aldolase n=1 Tax=Gracilibacillus alcaliphilus TaxID=1401441 RepID=UPI00195C6CDD|nr:class II fructose-1,6-bisphosphate aldolase [Gracilibacillus alcaliphilus]MBM7676733.1 6-phospho-5-dehydro-2-deoxy-D-gluconate aldolase [Gracilibacillus alcaliphilus]
MVFVSLKDLLPEAKKNNYAIGQFNINSFQWVEAILRAAQQQNAPVILASTDRIVDYLGGLRLIATTTKKIVEEMKITVPVVLHLDHGFTIERCKEAIDAGYSSVMYDGSKLPLKENIAQTKEVVDYAKRHHVSVEAEIGSVGGTEDGVTSGIKYADPNECYQLVESTGIDALAAALGSVHGPYQGEPKLAFDLMKEISDHLQAVPFALHGGSGIPDHQIVKTIAYGHAKINVNTECNQAWAQTIRELLTNNPALYSPPDILGTGMKAIEKVVTEKIQLFGSANKAAS